MRRPRTFTDFNWPELINRYVVALDHPPLGRLVERRGRAAFRTGPAAFVRFSMTSDRSFDAAHFGGSLTVSEDISAFGPVYKLAGRSLRLALFSRGLFKNYPDEITDLPKRRVSLQELDDLWQNPFCVPHATCRFGSSRLHRRPNCGQGLLFFRRRLSSRAARAPAARCCSNSRIILIRPSGSSEKRPINKAFKIAPKAAGRLLFGICESTANASKLERNSSCNFWNRFASALSRSATANASSATFRTRLRTKSPLSMANARD